MRPLRLKRAYYHCASCGNGFYPRDRALGLDGVSLTSGLTKMVGHVGALTSFAEGSALLHELAGVLIDAKQVERTAERLGQEIRAMSAAWSPRMIRWPITLYPGMEKRAAPDRRRSRVPQVGLAYPEAHPGIAR